MDLIAIAADWTIDSWTVVVGLLCVSLRWFMQSFSIRMGECVISFLNGATMVPFFVLAGSVFSPDMLGIALASKGPTALAGVVGIFFVLGETIAPNDLRRRVKTTQGAVQIPPEANQ